MAKSKSKYPTEFHEWRADVRRILVQALRRKHRFLRSAKDEDEIRITKVAIENDKKFLREWDAVSKTVQ